MKIEHVAIWTPNIERLREFYCTHFGGVAGPRYENRAKGFASYFVRFAEGARLEIMQKTGVGQRPESEVCGFAHLAISVGSENEVRVLTERSRAAGVRIQSEPRWTGDGYFESVLVDPDGNRVEITI